MHVLDSMHGGPELLMVHTETTPCMYRPPFVEFRQTKIARGSKLGTKMIFLWTFLFSREISYGSRYGSNVEVSE